MAALGRIENRAVINFCQDLGKTQTEAYTVIKKTPRKTSVGSVRVLRGTNGLRKVEIRFKSAWVEGGNLTSSPKGNDRSFENKQVFLNSSLVSKDVFNWSRAANSAVHS